MFLYTKKNDSHDKWRHLAPMSGRSQGVVGTVTNRSHPLSRVKGVVAAQLQLIVVMQKSRLMWPDLDLFKRNAGNLGF